METAVLNVTEEAGGGALGFEHSTSVVVHEPPVAQTVVAQISQGLVVVILLFHTLMIYFIFAVFSLQSNKKRRKKQLGEARKQVAEDATLKLVLEIWGNFGSV